jgi:hypothetical protein
MLPCTRSDAVQDLNSQSSATRTHLSARRAICSLYQRLQHDLGGDVLPPMPELNTLDSSMPTAHVETDFAWIRLRGERLSKDKTKDNKNVVQLRP